MTIIPSGEEEIMVRERMGEMENLDRSKLGMTELVVRVYRGKDGEKRSSDSSLPSRITCVCGGGSVCVTHTPQQYRVVIRALDSESG